ncbi:MAG: hypothetical protein ACOVNU_08065 [Candidatus Kapaibacteriota bacterium]
MIQIKPKMVIPSIFHRFKKSEIIELLKDGAVLERVIGLYKMVDTYKYHILHFEGKRYLNFTKNSIDSIIDEYYLENIDTKIKVTNFPYIGEWKAILINK